jgi:hypothetical protein
MPNDLPVPPELQHLIEKRENEDRRKSQRRGGQDRREEDLGPLGRIESVDDLQRLAMEEERSGRERRKDQQRRATKRRKADAGNRDDDSTAE